MKLYDTAKKAYCQFEPDHLVRIYVCGITPYDSAHLGHIFTFMTYDLLQRRLEDTGHEVRMVRNITDVDEPIYAKARQLGIHYAELAAHETAAFQDTLTKLNFRTPFAEPLASEYIDQMVAAVRQLYAAGFAYKVADDMYYDVGKFPKFAAFSGFGHRLLWTFMRERGGDPERPGKRHPLDFLLWKSIIDPADPAQWPSEFGSGRPGWHIECTVMSQALLGAPFDLHGGGTDLIFPHHSAEIAQSYGLDEACPAKHWLHVSPLLYAGEKMSKSLGNLVFAKDLLGQHEFAAIRLALMHYHHRIGGEWQPELLMEAEKLLRGVRTRKRLTSLEQAHSLLLEVRGALDDDLNTLEIIDALHRFVDAHGQIASPDEEAITLVDKTLSLLGLQTQSS